MRDLDDASYVPGSWVAITAVAGCLLVDLVPEDPVVRRCWKLLSEDAGAEAVLDALVTGGIARAPGFALVVRVDGGVRVLARHPAVVDLHDTADGSRVEATAGVSWCDVRVAVDPDAVSLHGPSIASSIELPMGTGVTTASVVHLRRGAPAAPPLPHSEPGVPTALVTAPEPVAEPAHDPIVAPAAEPIVDTTPEPVVERAPEPASDPDGDSYDHLFGASIQRPVPHPVPRPAPSPTPDVPPAPPAASDQTAGWMTMPPAPAPAASAPPVSAAEAVIEGVPWASDGSAVPPPPPPLPPPPSSGSEASTAPIAVTPLPPSTPVPSDDTGATVNRAQLHAAAPQATGPTVLAGTCPAGHLSPPYADRCRVCRRPMPAQDAVEIARPTLGVLRLPSGDLVTLDRGALLGRSPDVPTGADRPHVLRLRSPDNDISRNHAEIVLDGWNVYVRDLGSTNGTVVELSGREPVRLRDNDLTLLEDGARLTLADEITVVFEVQA